MKIKVTGAFRKIAETSREDGWGVNFGPASDVHEPIPGSGGVTLCDLRAAGEIPDDCFDDEDEVN